MKIMFIVRDLSIGGINSVTSMLASELISNDHEVKILTLKKSENEGGYYENCNIHHTMLLKTAGGILARIINKAVPFFGSKLLRKYLTDKIIQHLSKETYDAVFLCGFGVYINFQSEKIQKSIIVSHNIKSLLIHKKSRLLIKKNICLLREISDKNRIYAVSQAIRKDWVERIGSNPDNIKILYNPINEKKIKDLCSDVNPINSSNYYVYCGRLASEKNIIWIIQNYINTGIKKPLIIVGNGNEEKKIKSYIRTKKLEKQVFMAGLQKNPYPILKNAKAVILNSDFEGLPTIALESQILGVNLIIGECGGAAYDVVKPNYHSYIFKKDDAAKYKENILLCETGNYPTFEFDKKKFSLKETTKNYVDAASQI